MDTSSRRVTAAGVPVRWEEQGEGTAVVLLHGIPTSPALWRHVLPLLDGVRALAFEMVGYGWSIPAGRDHDISVSAQADHLIAWLDELEIDRAVLVGHDLGGGVAQIAAVRHPERCAGLVLTNAVCYDSWPIPAVRAVRAVPGLVAKLPDALFRTGIGTLMARAHDDARIARDSLDIHVEPYLAHGGASALARQASTLDADDTLAIADRLPGLDVPARVVWGVADQFQKAAYGERLARALGTRPVGIRGGRHFTPEDHPAEIAAAVQQVVAAAEAAR